MTAFIQFIVLKREGKWVVKANDLERFFSVQREAVDAAIRLANDSGKEGKPGAVLFQKSKSEFEKIWTYGEDPYPPARSDLPAMSGTPEPGKLADAVGLARTFRAFRCRSKTGGTQVYERDRARGCRRHCRRFGPRASSPGAISDDRDRDERNNDERWEE
jgi:hypothetical protein